MQAEIVDGYGFSEEVGELLQEYTRGLVEQNPDFAAYLKRQNFTEELQDLEGKYGRPAGRLYLLRCDAMAAGTVALHPLDEERCELKRLYVRPAYRGHGYAEALVRKVLRDAGEIGYRQVLMDTFPFLTAAITLYRKVGFYDIPSYNGSPMPELLYMRWDVPR